MVKLDRGTRRSMVGISHRRASMRCARLQITAAQDPAWRGLAAAMLEQANQTDRARTRLFESTGNAAERMTLRAELMMIEAEAFEMVAHAFNGLYAVLTPVHARANAPAAEGSTSRAAPIERAIWRQHVDTNGR